MSYCVNCGVELGESEKKCPLCGIKVMNPLKPYDPKIPRPYPLQKDIFSSKRDRQKSVVVVSLLLFLSAAICLAVELIYSDTITWSLYPVGALLMLWVFVVSLLLVPSSRQMKPIIVSLLDAAALLGFLWLCNYLTQGDWFMAIAFPVVGMLLLASVFILICMMRLKLRRPYIASIITLTVSAIFIGIEIVIDYYLAGSVDLAWSLYLVIPCGILAAFFGVAARQRILREELRRRLHM